MFDYKDKIHVVYHGVDIAKFNPLKKQDKPGIDILSVTQSLTEKKGLDHLIKAVHILKQRRLNIKCRIIGKGRDTPRLEQMISRHDLRNNICLLEPMNQEELIKFYGNSKIFVLPCIVAKDGDRDGIPNVLAEAMAMGMPVISSKMPNIAELIENEYDGILTQEGSPKKLAMAIERLLSNNEQREALGRHAREKIETILDAKKHIRVLSALLKESSVTGHDQ